MKDKEIEIKGNIKLEIIIVNRKAKYISFELERGRPLNKAIVITYNHERKQYMHFKTHHGEFDPGSEETLAACITHASRTKTNPLRV